MGGFWPCRRWEGARVWKIAWTWIRGQCSLLQISPQGKCVNSKTGQMRQGRPTWTRFQGIRIEENVGEIFNFARRDWLVFLKQLENGKFCNCYIKNVINIWFLVYLYPNLNVKYIWLMFFEVMSILYFIIQHIIISLTQGRCMEMMIFMFQVLRDSP